MNDATLDGRGFQTIISYDAREFRDIMYALQSVDRKVRDELLHEMKAAGDLVASGASMLAPRTGTGEMAGSYRARLRMSRMTDVAVQIRNDTPQGNILELAGSKSGGNTEQGKSLIATLNAKYCSTGRFAWEAYDQRENQVNQHIDAAIRTADAKAQAELGGAK